MIGIIAAVSINGIIGIYDNEIGKLPFHYSEDMKHFKKMTHNSVVIMGRKTFESIGKPLPKRENIVITSKNLKNSKITCYTSIAAALGAESVKLRDHEVNTWFIGGASIYQGGMLYADEIHLTLTPDYIDAENTVKFPFINPLMFELYGCSQLVNLPYEKLTYAVYKRKKLNSG